MAAQYRLRGIDTAAPPWPLLIEVARETPHESWILVGGMMVHLHALRGRISATRPTTDVDLLLTLEAITRSIGEVAGPLQSLGMRLLDSRGPFHRFTRGDDIVDIMVSNQAGRATWAQRPIMRASGATLALHDPDTYLIESDGHDVRLSMPNTPAAIVLKAAAYRDDPNGNICGLPYSASPTRGTPRGRTSTATNETSPGQASPLSRTDRSAFRSAFSPSPAPSAAARPTSPSPIPHPREPGSRRGREAPRRPSCAHDRWRDATAPTAGRSRSRTPSA